MRRVIILLICMVIIIGLCACGSTEVPLETVAESKSVEESTEELEVSKSADKPVVIENMGRTTTYEKAPETAVALSYSIAEIMVALGLEDKIVAIAPSMYILDQVSEQYRDKVGALPILEGNYGVPTLETVLETDAEFVFGDSYSFYATSVGTAEDFDAANVKIYATEGTYIADSNLEQLYNDIINIGKIFRVDQRAEDLVSELRQREQQVRDNVADLEPVRVFYYDSDSGGGVDMSTIGGVGLQNYLLELAGGENIFADEEQQFFITSWEDVIKRDPEIIMVCDYYGEGFAEQKIAEMKVNPATAELAAVKADRFIVVPGLAMFPSLENLDVIEQMAKDLRPDR